MEITKDTYRSQAHIAESPKTFQAKRIMLVVADTLQERPQRLTDCCSSPSFVYRRYGADNLNPYTTNFCKYKWWRDRLGL
jgi:hypothetical protein